MKISELLKDCDYFNIKDKNALMSIDISGAAYDSRNAGEGYVFVSIQGEKHDGHDFIADVVRKGAVAIVHEKPINIQSLVNSHQSLKRSPVNSHSSSARPGNQCPATDVLLFIKVKNSRRALACIANNFYGRPSEGLTITGITGTNGKTTTTFILKSILDSWGKNVGMTGTIQYMIKDKVYPAPYTTPESLEFQRLLRDMLLSKCTHVISEVSSHALSQYRADGTIFTAAVFTNLTRDHLDFHKTMEDYFAAKKRLFIDLLKKEGTAVINLDDTYGKRLNSEMRTLNSNFKKILTCGLEQGADIIASNILNTFQGLRFRISFRDRNYDIFSHLTGMPNVYNIMSAAGAALALGVPWDAILEGIEEIENIRGRFEKIDLGQDFLCIIDYAHTEDALERLILTAKELISPPKSPPTKGGTWGSENSSYIPHARRIITVFGCGGNRDRGKRPGMGAIATRLSDVVIITSDNPRFEEPLDIIREIESGVVSSNYTVEPDRREAIRKAVNMAVNGDIVLIAGKGHEDYQEIKGVRYKFSDRDVVEDTIKKRMQDAGYRI